MIVASTIVPAEIRTPLPSRCRFITSSISPHPDHALPANGGTCRSSSLTLAPAPAPSRCLQKPWPSLLSRGNASSTAGSDRLEPLLQKIHAQHPFYSHRLPPVYPSLGSAARSACITSSTAPLQAPVSSRNSARLVFLPYALQIHTSPMSSRFMFDTILQLLPTLYLLRRKIGGLIQRFLSI